MGVQKCCGQEECTENYTPLKNDRRCQLINEVKQIIGSIEHADKAKPRQSRRSAKAIPGMRDLEDECKQWRKRRDCTPPLITTIAIHETRPTSDYTNMRHENSSQVTFVDATKEDQEWRKVPPAPWDLPRTPSQELRSGSLYTNCQCLKRNGLQHDCPRWECGGRPECVAVNPGPCCEPSQWPKPIRGDRRIGNSLTQEKTYVTGQNFEGKQLKTGPLNPEICIPLGSQPPQQLRQGPSDNTCQAGKFIDGRKVPQGELIGMLDISSMCQEHTTPKKVNFQNGTGRVPNQAHQDTQTLNPQGKSPMDVFLVVDLTKGPRMENKPAAISEPSRGIVLSAPGVTCSCRPVNEQASGRPFQPQIPENRQRQPQGISTGPEVTFCCRTDQGEPTSGIQRPLPQSSQGQRAMPTPDMIFCRLIQSAPAS
ncbi:uncharacterized protein LOC128996872 [Macrosteles quadrilineatus]|uniref:uncharacterized protein LOC128996872 n=1 Tax=Macrosteles quadrilineatus TaxID=74068 RepID=UPI0023E0DC3B|nr:uncharacterized protein LOC128996872 [Macrosteles quadrilineatus]